METDSSAVISIESDEETNTVAEPEVPISSLSAKESEKLNCTVPNNMENGSNAPKSPDNVTNKESVMESDIICLDDEKETAEVCGERSAKILSDTVTPSEMDVSNHPAVEEAVENNDIEMKEIAKDVEDKDRQQTDSQPEQRLELMEDVQTKAILEAGKTPCTIDIAAEAQEPVLPNNTEQKLPNIKRRAQKCANATCGRKVSELYDAPVFAQNLYKIPPSNQMKLICLDCYDFSIVHFESLCASLVKEESLYATKILQDQTEEIHTVLDSSDEEESNEPTVSEPNEIDPALPIDVISLVNTDLNDIVESLWEKYGAKQITLYNGDMLREAEENEEISNRIDAQLKTLKATLQSIHENIYSVRTTKIDTPELIIEDDAVSEFIAYDRLLRMLNANGTVLIREPVKVNETYYGVSSTILGSWMKCKVVDVSENQFFTVRFNTSHMRQSVLSAKHLAYPVAPQVKLKLGTRIIAKVCAIQGKESSRTFYAGTVLESISAYNKFRYLIIFDFGHTLYAPLTDVRVVCEQSKNIWDDVHPHSREFIRNYMQTCGSLRPMVQAKRGQRMMVEMNRKWLDGRVCETDSSLIRLYFHEMRKYEWIYRGSKRLAPLYSTCTTNKFSKFQRRNEPSIEYITIEDDENEQQAEQKSPPGVKTGEQETQNRPTARKSTVQRNNARKNANSNVNIVNVPSVISLNQKPIYIDMDKDRSHGKTVHYNTNKYRGPQKFVPHTCGPHCLYKMPSNLHTYNLLARPLVTGWERHFCFVRGAKKSGTVVMYRAPCGRRLRDMQEVHRYLSLTNCALNVEHFEFEAEILALATFSAENFLFECKDLSFGAELMPVHCVNNYENMQPPPCEYSTERIPTEGVNLNLDKEFLCGCDCEDDCLDKSKCQCWQLTIAGVQYTNPDVDINNVGYVYKRLFNQIHTGVYECNTQCKCKKDKCLNRVVQNSLQTKLQVFNTNNKGWGIRCINDVPMGSFICIYAGHLLTEEVSTKICELSENKTGDEYFADLDYIETAVKTKDNYESDAYQSDNEREGTATDESEIELEKEKFTSAQDSDEEYTSKTLPSAMVVKTRAQSKRASTTERPSAPATKDKESIIGMNDEQECVSLIPNPEMNPEENSRPNAGLLFRRLYGDKDDIFIMDAKKSGNLGRYFNHSCVPNLFVQNVFVDTHDLRFPWVAFFASKNIKAGTELTWNYNYDVGSVSGKVLNCTCGEKGCKGRLL
ncbi:histone-lysine N-methyltransferase eggless [Anopheles moucheti]|uniref:histone-lysine N-methyltransferase eggless n=1 Tax=Anopheles moucheti TaxID=186751 RepID=UPI0022F02F8E|nr:histone-lysine N-methyltransferase eggless [Anopheles moucheti]